MIENLNNPQPQVVPSELIANKLDMSVKETCHLLKIMNEMGVVVSGIEGKNALITKEGVSSALFAFLSPGEQSGVSKKYLWRYQ